MESEIRTIAQEALEKAKSIFNTTDVRLEIVEDSENSIPETGSGGFNPDSHTIIVYFDSKNPKLKENLEAEIKSTVMHEFFHAIRSRTFDWSGNTLLDAMVTEGLADHFDIEVNGGSPKPWSIALSETELKNLRKIAEPKFNDRGGDHSDWLFGSSKRNIPRWTGYSLGFKIVADYLKKTNKKASELVSAPAESFIQ